MALLVSRAISLGLMFWANLQGRKGRLGNAAGIVAIGIAFSLMPLRLFPGICH